uniref:Ribonuclease, RNase K a n=1 Tax=Gasterosteus aculeatus aculeatus TaxID=481459 RepID=A0AAQ4QFR5_GASAC
MRGLICGPKLAACGLVLSTWGVIMLAMLGIFYITHSAVLIEDVPVMNHSIYQDGNPERIYALYNKVGYNCFIAAAIYIVFAVFSCCQLRLNKQKVTPSIWLCGCSFIKKTLFNLEHTNLTATSCEFEEALRHRGGPVSRAENSYDPKSHSDSTNPASNVTCRLIRNTADILDNYALIKMHHFFYSAVN